MHTVDGCEILHHQKDGWNPINNGRSHLSTCAGFRNHPLYLSFSEILAATCRWHRWYGTFRHPWFLRMVAGSCHHLPWGPPGCRWIGCRIAGVFPRSHVRQADLGGTWSRGCHIFPAASQFWVLLLHLGTYHRPVALFTPWWETHWLA